jgi:hypothetical protein
MELQVGHPARTNLFESSGPVRESVRWRWGTLRVGDSVRLKPGTRADVLDLALSGRVATVDSIEMDYEDRFHVAVTVDDDPGCDLGRMRQPGHRFFFALEDLEPSDVAGER